ncbi:MAG: DUF11 domain-containing protein [Planctomycetaceae bacterium]|nr:DUF11 domain-containing protein [Planctomycetaceae bacterium]
MKRMTFAQWMIQSLASQASTKLLVASLLMFSSSCSTARNYAQRLKRESPAVAESEITEAGSDSSPVTDSSREEPPVANASSSRPVEEAGSETPDVRELIAEGHDPFASEAGPGSEIETAAASDVPEFSLQEWVDEGNEAAAASPQMEFAVEEAPAFPAETDVALASASQEEDWATYAGKNWEATPLTELEHAAQPQTLEGPVEHSPEPRVALAGPEGWCPPSGMADCPTGQCPPTQCPPNMAWGPAAFPSIEDLSDEYVCDGGDKKLPVHYEGDVRAGLDSEDTVVEYVDHTGEQHVKPSTTACLYAPRFGAVRSSTLPETGITVDKALGHQDDMKVAGLDLNTALDEQTRADEAIGIEMRERASGLEAKAEDQGLHQNLMALDHVKLQNTYEDFQFIREGQFGKADEAVVGLALQAAHAWLDGRRPVIVAHDQAGQMVQARATAHDYTAIEDRRKKGELVIVKVADKAAAHPGEEVTFTIRFDNVGDRELLGVRVIDNLSPRLQFVEGSVQSDLDGFVDVKENGAGGQLLTFEFDKPLEGKSGGYLSFKTIVR